jgi:hypothetical protein
VCGVGADARQGNKPAAPAPGCGVGAAGVAGIGYDPGSLRGTTIRRQPNLMHENCY